MNVMNENNRKTSGFAVGFFHEISEKITLRFRDTDISAIIKVC